MVRLNADNDPCAIIKAGVRNLVMGATLKMGFAGRVAVKTVPLAGSIQFDKNRIVSFSVDHVSE